MVNRAFVLAVVLAWGQGAPDSLRPRDIHPESRSRLAPVKRGDLDERGRRIYDGLPAGLTGAAALRLHSSGSVMRWRFPLGRAAMELAIVTTAREYDQPYEWSLHAQEALAVGLDPDVLEVVRMRRPLDGLGDTDAIIVQVFRDVVGRHRLDASTYARAVTILGERNLVDLIDTTSRWAYFAPSLTAFNQHMPPGWIQTLPLPFEQPGDIHPDSRNRLPLMLAPPGGGGGPPALYSRSLSPAGTGPGQISRHGGGLESLEANVGRPLMGLAILIAARAHDQQYDWTMNEMVALKDGLDPLTIDVVRRGQPTDGLGEREAALIEFGRELFGRHYVTPATYARTVRPFGERDLVDLVALMSQHASDAMMLTAFDQHLPAGVAALLPLP